MPSNRFRLKKMPDESDIFAEVELRRKQLLEQLAAAPIVDVLGVVASRGSSGGKGGREELWTMTFTFEAWRINAGDLQTQPLTIRRKVTQEELDELMELIAPCTVIHVRARVVRDSLLGPPEGLLESVIGTDGSDTE